ncbi:Tagatose-6-phosphate kinase [Microbacterium lemovicicum]|uniref:1-phosphofructokinase n=1 Tax=Microbacterium lemovicicum TaxID=1072463 RepID=A0A3S9WAM9_9MICO|nr:1-phosphofructokinase [Microbacterium lemovicicum]AZS37074.1 Tagatose-6-phosphate kinase [Microbacterium lemovicicum]
MIVTVTANPSLDRAVRLTAPLTHGEVQRAADSREDAGGKGVNVSRALSAAGVATVAVLPSAADDPYLALVERTGVDIRRIDVAGRVRANLTVADPDGTTTKINLPGAQLDRNEKAALIDGIVTASRGADWVVLAGSLPPGAGDGFYTEVVEAVRGASRGSAPRIAVDTSGAALAHVVAHARPDLIKPNEDELAELVGEGPAPAAEVLDAAVRQAQTLVADRVGAVLVTLGADGALLVTADEALRAAAPRITVASTVGAGDSSLAGYLIAADAGGDPAQCLRSAVVYGAAAASLPGTQIPTPADVPHWDIVVTALTPR